jgi:hypothetical protein
MLKWKTFLCPGRRNNEGTGKIELNFAVKFLSRVQLPGPNVECVYVCRIIVEIATHTHTHTREMMNGSVCLGFVIGATSFIKN